MSVYTRLLLVTSFLALMTACRQHRPATQFLQLSANESGIKFNNQIDESKFEKEALNEFAYMGSGVGIGDFNKDGLKDIFFCGNQVSSRLYLNRGANRFEDITEKAGITTTNWCTGVSIADVNADGWDDIYICNYGKSLSKPAANQLFINQQNGSFKEEAAIYGLADTSFSTQAAFLDYDLDGDLDMYLVNYRFNGPNANSIFPKNESGHSPANDKLYRNDGAANGSRQPHFTDVSMEAGIREDGYGLGVSVSDFNGDGWPDIFVANDFLSNDDFWINNGNGTFSNKLDQATRHQSYSSMGSDAADINNDGLIDFATLDMMPEDNERKKLTHSFMNYDRYEAERNNGYSPEFMRNMLQLNQGYYHHGDTIIPYFSEIGQLAGISETDWSWSILFADVNNDGWKDIHITNGIGRDFVNADFIQFGQELDNEFAPEKQRELLNKKLRSLNYINLPNYCYQNNHNLGFINVSESMGINEPSLSTGCAYADLDNDGDLDLIVNNINSEPFIFLNQVRQNVPDSSHFICFQFEGAPGNQQGLGARITIYTNGSQQLQEQWPVRGYCSSVDNRLLFGTGKSRQVDSLLVTWPGGKTQTIHALKADSLYTISEKNAVSPAGLPAIISHTLLTNISDSAGLTYFHTDNSFNDFAFNRLIPQKFSQQGPFIATGDIQGDQLTDIFIGGATQFPGALLKQQPNGSFQRSNLPGFNKWEEDMQAVFFDADKDGDQDLLVTRGDYRFADTSIHLRPTLYLNDGKGNFQPDSFAIPSAVRCIAGAVAIADFDRDGDNDIFIGGRVAGRYPTSPRSFLLQNNNGLFTDITEKICPELQRAGMITGAQWADLNGDQYPELVLAGEWMPIRFFSNKKTIMREYTDSAMPSPADGMWRSLLASDIDNDGDIDFVAGNMGLNNRYKISAQYPMMLFAKDIDKNGSLDPIPFYWIKTEDTVRRLIPAINRDPLAEQVPAIKKRFLSHQKYAGARFADIFPDTSNLIRLQCSQAASGWCENLGNGKFRFHAFPIEAQFAPVNAIVCEDIDGDGIKDLILAGNEYQGEVMSGRYDASYGLLLKGGRGGNFKALPAGSSGLRINGDVKSMAVIRNKARQRMLLVAVNNGALQTYLLPQ
ncbi:VCBS repeat-containing protein [Flavihumibacter petaseus]|uniref:ASPIC/UnbV domain-containing protein n=1 Tax=Flavihumibacter petaseus NBRC 106054 TaxID=1220578 RepID=A0A0E9MYP5_9BACT|nr:VCBS repeat-containing protein [Flavihumibacter petaseus]GAO42633.1 hypothetical protein FPE01S_01_16480 [Flavihumibacter petaseus NBRC 106054]